MITLITYAPAFGQPAASPFCIKAMMLLNMSGQDWQPEYTNDPRKMPMAKLPVLRTDTGLIPDSENIQLWLAAQGADFNAGLTPLELAQSHALIRMAEEHLYFHLVMDRWGDDAVWPTIRDTYFSAIPKIPRIFVTNKLRRNLMRSMHSQGIARFTPAERLERANRDLAAIAAHLTTPYLFGDHPTAADASVAAFLGAIIATPVATLLGDRVRGDKLLVDYVDRMQQATL